MSLGSNQLENKFLGQVAHVPVDAYFIVNHTTPNKKQQQKSSTLGKKDVFALSIPYTLPHMLSWLLYYKN